MNSDHGIMTPQFIYDRYEQWSWMINDHNWSYDHWSWMINDHNWSYDHWSYMIGVHRCSYERWSSMINDHTDSCMNVLFMLWKAIDHSYDMLIIAMNRVLIMHDSIHNHVIMNIIVNPITCAQFLGLDSPLLCGFMVWQNPVISDVLSWDESFKMFLQIGLPCFNRFHSRISNCIAPILLHCNVAMKLHFSTRIS